MKTIKKLFVLSLFILLAFSYKVNSFAAKPTDEITYFEVDVTVNEDASLDMIYTVEWKVLESDSIGPLEWVQIGVPNNDIDDYENLTDNINKITLDGFYMRVDFDRKYYEGETVYFSYKVHQGSLYQVDKYSEGSTVFEYTVPWFDDIAVDNLVVRWNLENVSNWSPTAELDGTDIIWNTSLNPGEKFYVSVYYPNDAYDFITTNTIYDANSAYNYYEYEEQEDNDYVFDMNSDGKLSLWEIPLGLIAIIIAVIVIFSPIVIPFVIVFVVTQAFKGGKGLGTSYENKITRTKIVYYPTCQGCGGVREEGQNNCTYCGRSFIKSEETITETDKEKTDPEIMKHTTAGTYHYGSDPNTYVRVHVTRVAVPHTSSSSGSSSRGASSHHSSCACAHSCACACGCACACACAGGGRAGCSSKDFYNTNLKLKMLERRSKKGQKN